MSIVFARKEHCAAIAQLHMDGIKTGFLPNLGHDFLTRLYKAMVDSRYGLLLVALDEWSQIQGFVSASKSTRKFCLSFMLCPFGIKSAFSLLAKRSKKPRQTPAGANGFSNFLEKCGETLSYPFRNTDCILPEAELLSIVVKKENRGGGIGGELIAVLKKRFSYQGIKKFRVVVGSDNKGACRFYERYGGKLIKEVEVHKGEISNLYTFQTA